MAGALLALLAAAAAAAAAPTAPPIKEVSPLVVAARPRGAPVPDVTLQVAGGDLRGQDVAIWPAGAREAGLSGYATLACLVDVHGLAESCRVVFEAPPGRGFGAAALALRPTFKVAPAQGPDGPIEATLKIAVDFRLPQLQTNLQEVAAARAPALGTMTGDSHADPGNHEISAANLTISDSPVAMRRMTMMTEPAWVQAPGFEAWAAAYPAAGGGVEGYAVAHCKVDRAGVLSRCAVVKELPQGRGFGRAAVALASQFRASPEALAAAPRGAPVEVDVPVRFPPPAEAKDRVVKAPLWIAGRDPQSLARELPAPAPGRKPGRGAVVQCRVGEAGQLADCGIEFTSPEGLEFDEAAVRLAGQLRMNLWSADAQPVQGGIVHVPLRLDLAGQEARN